ncbi:hypothetical protein OPV22_017139 [Ensete ventricosum]|uniref:Uncharacterized protein n=1 Tax=Ensete ventricosum TaxID=4639 RepID=A0AAV8QX45_ENSVE|nr:hypothetical protein OPV22_017139 [Ensete ventricosum]
MVKYALEIHNLVDSTLRSSESWSTSHSQNLLYLREHDVQYSGIAAHLTALQLLMYGIHYKAVVLHPRW